MICHTPARSARIQIRAEAPRARLPRVTEYSPKINRRTITEYSPRRSTDVCLTRRARVSRHQSCGACTRAQMGAMCPTPPLAGTWRLLAPVRTPRSAQPPRGPTHLRGPAARADSALRRRRPATEATLVWPHLGQLRSPFRSARIGKLVRR
jgi:hypothetical protein